MQEGDVRHRLLAILAADAAGYSRLMAGDDVATLRALDAAREVFRTHIEAHEGRVIDMAGDSVLASFETVGGAVNASREIQEILTDQSEELPESKRLQFRIGIHLGDVLEKSDGTVYGDGVNIAARLQALAEPGGITVSHAVRDAVFNRVGAAFEDLGEQTVKNIERPVQAFRMRWERMAGAVGALNSASSAARADASRKGFFRNKVAPQGFAAGWLQSIRRRWWAAATVVALVGLGTAWLVRSGFGPQQRSTAEPPPMSLAIAPLTAPAGDTAAEQFAQSLRRDLMTGLAAVARSVKTVQSDSDGNVAGSVNSPDRSRRPNARYLVEGDVRRGDGGHIAVNLRMIDSLAGAQFWGEQFELPDTLSTVESPIMRRQIVGRLVGTVWDAETRRVMALPLERLQATELVLRSYALADESATRESVVRAHKLLDNALHLDPNWVLALVGRTNILNGELDVDPHPDRDRIAREMDEFSSRATKLDPTDPQAWSARSLALAIGHRWNAALEAIDQAIRFDPYGSGHYADKAWLMNMNGQPAKALPLIDQAIALKPRSIAYAMRVVCEAHLFLGHTEEVITTCEKAAGLDNNWGVQLFLVAAYANKGDLSKAAAAKAQVLKTVPGYTISQLRAKRYSVVPEYLELAEKNWYAGLRKAGIPD